MVATVLLVALLLFLFVKSITEYCRSETYYGSLPYRGNHLHCRNKRVDIEEIDDAADWYGTEALEQVDGMDGHRFEYFCAEVLGKNGFTQVQVTRGSGDQGVDILAEKDGVKYAVQCKKYSAALGNTPVQEVNAGKLYYGCHVGVVMTNSTFTMGAIELAKVTGVLLWDRARLQEMMGVPGAQNWGQKEMTRAFAESQLIGRDEFMWAYGTLLMQLHGDAEFMSFIYRLRRRLNGAELTHTRAANKEIMNAFYYSDANGRFAPVREIVDQVKSYGKQASAHISIYYAMYVLDLK